MLKFIFLKIGYFGFSINQSIRTISSILDNASCNIIHIIQQSQLYFHIIQQSQLHEILMQVDLLIMYIIYPIKSNM